MPTNYCLASNGATAVATSEILSASLAIDDVTYRPGGTAHDWLSAADPATAAQELVVDFGASRYVSYWELHQLWANNTPPNPTDSIAGNGFGGAYGDEDYTIELYDGTWHVVATKTGQNQAVQSGSFTPGNYTKIKARVTKSSGGGLADIAELKCFDVQPGVMTVGTGNFVLTGQNVNLIADKVLQAGYGSFALNGQDVNLISGKSLQAGYGSFALNGQNVNLLANKVLQAGHGSFALTGQNVNFTTGIISLESSYSPNTDLEAPVELTFTDASSGEVTDQRIKFGDFTERTQADNADFSHTYLAPGTYKFERWAKIDGIEAYETYDIVIGGTPTDDGLVTFDEIEIPREYLQGVTGGPNFLTSILGNPATNEQRDISREDARWEFQFGYKQKEETLKGLLEFFMTRQGQAIGFRLFSPFDNSWNDEEIARTSPETDTYALIRTYSKAGRTHIRRILKPVPDLVVTINDDPATDYSSYTINYATGEIIFDAPDDLPEDGSLKVTGYYCIPVYFKTDGYLPTTFDFGLGGIFQELNLSAVEILPVAFGLE